MVLTVQQMLATALAKTTSWLPQYVAGQAGGLTEIEKFA
jgi:hypothetical protein